MPSPRYRKPRENCPWSRHCRSGTHTPGQLTSVISRSTGTARKGRTISKNTTRTLSESSWATDCHDIPAGHGHVQQPGEDAAIQLSHPRAFTSPLLTRLSIRFHEPLTHLKSFHLNLPEATSCSCKGACNEERIGDTRSQGIHCLRR